MVGVAKPARTEKTIMKIGLISDTHDQLKNIERAFSLLGKEKIDLVCHLGDWIAPYSIDLVASLAEKMDVPLKGVLGNNDGEVFIIVGENPRRWKMELGQQTLTIEAEGRTIILYHGTDPNLTEGLIASGNYDAVFSGHFHVPRNEMVNKTLALNPGTLSGYSLDRGGQIKIGEFAVYDSQNNTAKIIEFPLNN